jgi:glycosyltransferase involved in cell wall biosynthesis
MENTFKIIIPSYNAKSWIGKCLDSVKKQKYLNWQLVIIDDASNDDMLSVVKESLKDIDKNNFKVFRRNINMGAMENIVYGINSICKDDEDIIVLLDGDDWLASDTVLNTLNEAYSDPNIWMTYGQFQYSSSKAIGTGTNITDVLNYRKSNFCSSHLRTFKYWLWKKIDNKDFRDSSGKYYSMAWDMSIMFPLIEMCGVDHFKFIDKILYIYNNENPINDHKKNRDLQILMDMEIRNKKIYHKVYR